MKYDEGPPGCPECDAPNEAIDYSGYSFGPTDYYCTRCRHKWTIGSPYIDPDTLKRWREAKPGGLADYTKVLELKKAASPPKREGGKNQGNEE